MKCRKPKMVFLPEGICGKIPNASSASSGGYDNDDEDDEDNEWTTHIECHGPRGPHEAKAAARYEVIEKKKEKEKEKETESRRPNDGHKGRSVVTTGTDEAVGGYNYEVMEKKKKKKKKSSHPTNNHRGRSVVTNGIIDEEQKKMVKQYEFWEQLQLCETQSSRDNNNNNSYGRQLSALLVPRSENKKDTSSSSTRRDSTVRISILSPLLSPRPTRVVKSSCCKPERVGEDDGNKNEKEETLDDDMTSTTVTETIEVIAPPFHRRSRSWRVGTWKLSREQTKKEQQKEERR